MCLTVLKSSSVLKHVVFIAKIYNRAPRALQYGFAGGKYYYVHRDASKNYVKDVDVI